MILATTMAPVCSSFLIVAPFEGKQKKYSWVKVCALGGRKGSRNRDIYLEKYQPPSHPGPSLSTLPCPLVARVVDGSKGGPNPSRTSLSPAPGIWEAKSQPELTQPGTFRTGSSQGAQAWQVPKSRGPGFSLSELWLGLKPPSSTPLFFFNFKTNKSGIILLTTLRTSTLVPQVPRNGKHLPEREH